MILREYPLGGEGREIKNNLEIDVRERGKLVPGLCRREHNIWVDEGRQYLARVIAPNVGQDDHHSEPPREFVSFMGLGIGGDVQTHGKAYQTPLSTDYPPASAGLVPGDVGNQQADTDQTVFQLERPVKIRVASPTWLQPVQTPVVFANSDRTLKLVCGFSLSDFNAVGPYTVVPLSEAGLMLSTADPDAADVYDGAVIPSKIGSGRQLLVAYNAFEPIPKTAAFELEFRWELRFA